VGHDSFTRFVARKIVRRDIVIVLVFGVRANLFSSRLSEVADGSSCRVCGHHVRCSFMGMSEWEA
jgi:hypothetical protein